MPHEGGERALRGRTRPADRVIAAGTLLLALFVGTLAHTEYLSTRSRSGAREAHALAARLGLTDLALFTEARYTRHPTQADLHTPFQDHPGALEHFPSGSLIGPPSRLRTPHAHLAGTAEVPD